MKLYVIRHGESEADILGVHEGRADFPLTERGKEQVRAMANYLSSIDSFDQIYASPLRRASQSAVILAEATGAPVTEMPELMEFNNGLLAGLPFEEARSRYPLPDYRAPHTEEYGMESMIAFRARVETAFSKIIHQTKEDGVVAIVCHGGTIQMLFRAFAQLGMDNAVIVRSGDAGVHLWEMQSNKRIVTFTNKTNWID